MINKIITTIAFLVALGTEAVAALAQHAATLSLPHTEGEDLPAKIADVNTTNTAHKEALLKMKNKQAALKVAVQAGRRFMMVLRESLKPTLGTKYSQGWTAVGFAGTLGVPSGSGPLLNALALAEAYLTAHPIADSGARKPQGRSSRTSGLFCDERDAAVLQDWNQGRDSGGADFLAVFNGRFSVLHGAVAKDLLRCG